MPRIDTLDMEFIGNHTNTRLDLREGRIYLGLGNEGDGKTFLLNAPDLAINGRCRLDRVDGEKLTVADLWDAVGTSTREAGEVPKVVLGLRNKEGRTGVLTRTRANWRLVVEGDEKTGEVGRAITTKEDLAEWLGVRDLGVVEVALRSQQFMALDSEARVRMLFAALGKPVTIAELAENGVTDPEVQKRVLSKTVRSGFLLAEEKRRAAAREAERLERPEPEEKKVVVPTGESVFVKDLKADKLTASLDSIREKRKEVQQKIGALRTKPDLSAEARLEKEARVEVTQAETAWTKARDALAALLGSEEAVTINGVREQKAALGKTYSECQDELRIWRGKVEVLKDGVVEAKKRLAWLEEHKSAPAVTCPTCGHSAELLVMREKFQQGVTAAEASLAEAVGQVKDLERFEGSTRADGQRLKKAIEDFDARIEEAKEKEQAARRAKMTAETHAERMKKSLEESRAQAAEAPKGVSEEDLAAKDEELAAKEAQVRELLNEVGQRGREWEAYAKAKESAKGFRATEKKYAAMQAALDDAGFLSQRVEEPRTLLREKVLSLSKAAFRETVRIEVKDDFTVFLNGRPAEFASRGQQWTVGAVLAAAITSLTGFGILVLDDLNMVGPKARDRVLGMLRKLAEAGEIEQVFVACIRDSKGWCDSCQSVSTEDAKGCVLRKPDGTRCGAAVGPSRPRGAMLGYLRTWIVSKGVVEEVAPIGAAVSA